MGAYGAILRRTPDHEDLVTTTDSEVLWRLVGRWVGQGGKVSLGNTADADLLEYILAKLAARIADESRTFLVKVKAHRGEPLNEGADDLSETGRAMARPLLVVRPLTTRRGAVESLMEERWRKGLFEERSEDTDGDQPMGEQTWRCDVSDKWDMIASGKWMRGRCGTDG